MLELFPLVDDHQLNPRHHPVALAYGQRDLAAVHLQDIALDLGEERGDLGDERGDRGRRRPDCGRGLGRDRYCAQSQEEDRGEEDQRREAPHGVMIPTLGGQGKQWGKDCGPGGRPPGPLYCEASVLEARFTARPAC